MGRRSINTTKSGKYMNPTDQARKEARKKELKKNKKQRQLVRAAVLKGKDPSQIIEEMEKIDQMEYNVMQPPPLNEKVLKDKRKKLKETLDRVLKMYVKDDHEKYVELKDQLLQYERRKIDLVSYFEAVRHAQQVHVDEIPLPATNTDMIRNYPGLPSQIPLPEVTQPSHPYPLQNHYMPQFHPLMTIPVPPSILKKKSSYTGRSTDSTLATNKEPPGVPPFVPPNFANESSILLEKITDNSQQKLRTIRFSDDKNDKNIDNENNEKNKNKDDERDIETVKPTSVQQKMLAMAGQDIDEFMRDMESAHKKKINEKAQDLNTRLSLIDGKTNVDSHSDFKNTSDNDNTELPDTMDRSSLSSIRQQQSSMHMMQQHHGMPSMNMPPPPSLLFRPSPPMHMRMPPPPPPPPRIGLRLPPGPPPGMPRMLRPGPPSMPRMPPPSQMPITNLSGMQNIQNSQIQNSGGSNLQTKTPNVLSAAPQLINRKDDNNKTTSTTTIEAKPQIRNLAADVTRFLPTSLRVKREDKKKLPSTIRYLDMQPIRPAQPKTKDDAYMQFMQEMEGLL
ncbi:hypothetical protein HCN44_006129 [Aphidius gifuensis]|uniref:Wbp11/ELF5/Saf1 N-terminal domain-containing protein n=1 Tax=Aphidius gifuensis TaxID=684658 RepID=A0A834Y1M2_APHGI|nr:WW domain-binding protein 11 [Aphidius gifuensis]KAF7997558.1 hypothetical protein HCN44_006129 [Aphidius gifuensis]